MATCTNHSEEKVVHPLNELFGATLSVDVIKTVAVFCGYDVQISSNKLLEMSGCPVEVKSKKMLGVGELNLASPQVVTKSKKTLDLEKAVAQINKGYKVMVILRGMPGSGKSFLARKILQSTVGLDFHHLSHIFSTDDFFYQPSGTYCYDAKKIAEAHNWTQRRALQAISIELSPIIIDNTNTQMWEMKPYATMATDYGYIIQIVEPDTHWSFNDVELMNRNTHGVPRVQIKKMIERYQNDITPEKLLSVYNLAYKPHTTDILQLSKTSEMDINIISDDEGVELRKIGPGNIPGIEKMWDVNEKLPVVKTLVQTNKSCITEACTVEAKGQVTTLTNDGIDDMENEIEILPHPSKTDSNTSESISKKLIKRKIDTIGKHFPEKLLRSEHFKFEEPPAVDSDLSVTHCIPPNADWPSISQERKYLDPENAILIDSDNKLGELDKENTADEPKVSEDTIELNIGEHFVSQLESHFGNQNFSLPKGLQPVVQVPLSLARQLYTFYVESVYQQMDNQNHVMETLIKKDEDFARKLQANEQEEFGVAQTVSIPNLNQIMEGQETSQKASKNESEKWSDLNPDNLAAKLAKQKLFIMFPTIAQDTLVEILYAHDNKYEDTVETLVSIGNGNVKGSLATIKEPPIKNEVLQEMKDAYKNNYCNEEYKERQEATFYRAESSKYLKRRSELFEKAEQYYQRGMTEVAQFYSSLANLQTKYSDKANGMAATSILEKHSKSLQANTLDLHFLYVKEAIPALDVFLDKNINFLRHIKTKQYKYLQIITGRGIRSENGISKIKPAVEDRLVKRKINYELLNPGLLKVKITKTSLDSSQISRKLGK